MTQIAEPALSAEPARAIAQKPVLPRHYSIRLAAAPREIAGCAQLRREVFCLEQKLFIDTDQDQHDVAAQAIVAVGFELDGTESIAGTVRIYQSDAGVWFGSRLAVASNWRGEPGLSAGLIRVAVCTAHGLGCQKFLANVQRQNVPLFRRLHWKSIGALELCGTLHHLMEADLRFYPPLVPSPTVLLGTPAEG